MSSEVQRKRNIRSILLFTSFTSAVAVIFALLSKGFLLSPVLNHLFFGIVFGLITSYLEYFFLEKRLRRMKFFAAVIIRSLLYIVLFISIILLIFEINVGFHNEQFLENAKKFGSLSNFFQSREFIIMVSVCVIKNYIIAT